MTAVCLCIGQFQNSPKCNVCILCVFRLVFFGNAKMSLGYFTVFGVKVNAVQ